MNVRKKIEKSGEKLQSNSSENVECPKDESNLALDFDEEIKYLRVIMKIVGIWPFAYSGKKIINCVNSCLSIFIVILTTKTYTIEWGDERAYQLIATIFLQFVTIKVFACKIFHREIRDIFVFMRDDWNRAKYLTSKRKNILRNYWRQAVNIAKYLGILAALIFTFAGVRPWVVSHMLKKPLTYYADVWYPFTMPSLFRLIMTLEGTMIICSAIAFVSLEVCIITITKHFCAQLKILSNTIEEHNGCTLHNIPADKYNCGCTKCIVERHLEIMKISKTIQKLFHRLLSINLGIGQLYVIATLITSFKQTGSESKYFMTILWVYSSLGMSAIFFCCHISEELRQKSLDIGDAVCNIQWHDRDKIDMKSYLMMIIFSKNMPIKITAGFFFTVSHELFKEFVCLWFSLFSVCRSINERTHRESIG